MNRFTALLDLWKTKQRTKDCNLCRMWAVGCPLQTPCNSSSNAIVCPQWSYFLFRWLHDFSLKSDLLRGLLSLISSSNTKESNIKSGDRTMKSSLLKQLASINDRKICFGLTTLFKNKIGDSYNFVLVVK